LIAMINRKDYSRKPKHHKVMINIRLRCISPKGRPTRRMIQEILVNLLENNTLPIGWQVAFVEWGNPRGSSVQWKPAGGRGGDLGDLSQFRDVIIDQINEMRIGVVRNDRLTGEEL
jgi:hypothetical protein